MAKRFYWLKMQENFFSRLEIKRLRKMPGGDTLVIIYQRLLLLSLRSEGVLTFQGYEQDLAEELALELDEPTDNVRAVLLYLQGHNLLKEVGANEYQLEHVLEATGSESESAERVRKYRERRAELPAPEETPEIKKTLQRESVTLQSNGTTLQCNTEKEKESKIEIDPEIEGETETTQPAAAGVCVSEPEKPERARVETVSLYEKRFEEFWAEYPKKVGKKAAFASWKKLKPDADLFERIMAAVVEAKHSEQWQRENGRFIPNPTTWINQGRWDDELPPVSTIYPQQPRENGGRPDTRAVLARIIAEEEGTFSDFYTANDEGGDLY